MQTWICTICNYGHRGEKPPEICVECGVGPEFFQLRQDQLEVAELSSEQLQEIKQSIFKISYGLYIITSHYQETINGQVANTAFQITSEPMRLVVGVNKQNYTHQLISQSEVFCVNILGQDGHRLVRRFGFRSGREFNKFQGIEYKLGITGAPIVAGCIGYLECRLAMDKVMDAGTHSLFLGDVIAGKLFHNEEPMTYAYYRATK